MKTTFTIIISSSSKMRYPSKYKLKEKDPGFRVHGSGPGDRELGIRNRNLSFCIHPSSFILHLSDLQPTAYSLQPRTGFGVQSSGPAIANSKFQILNRKLPRTLDSGQCEPENNLIHHSAFTLVEMLIVVAIVMILMVASLSVLQPVEDRRVREAAREVNVYVSTARNRAMELGRPCGVIFHRAAGTNFPSACELLDQCEVPPPYAGDVIGAVVRVRTATLSPSTFRIQIRANDFAPQLIRPGDLMQLNSQGPYYEIMAPNDPPSADEFPTIQVDPNNPSLKYFDFSTGTDSDGDGFIDNQLLTITLNTQLTPMQSLPWPTGQWSAPILFLILRQPVKSSASSLQLPADTVVDLDFSGTENPTQLFAGADDVFIVFSSNGSVEGYYLNGKQTVTGPIFLLIGKRQRVRDFVVQPLPAANPNLDELPNWDDLSSLWITINNQTGMVATSENSTYTGTPDWTAATTWTPFVLQSRDIARQQQSMGGR